ncbi:DUF547 domain-containing protein [Jejuia spongiicola]|uniref:DUF547 domain-containing protein n=1 Tax=Jejuia spongiicola TaxID=2942207 RepID=A0ABT0QAN5_9FLAO|nr:MULTISPECIES: DUF547 domain-containing protein [Flavobacteriaceae]MCL6294046.1 DUF547 domain-containing protein [Jejuia spongiicola]PIA78426.1 hypothetical protein BFR04_02505 [Gaetbulibacter sp. 4G1]
MKKQIIILVIILVSTKGFSQDVNVFFNKTNTFFETYVSNGKVAYSKVYENQEGLNELLNLAEAISVSKNDAKNYQAFWINAYNLSVIKGIIENYPTNSPLDNAGFFDKTKYSLAGKNITLNDIEHKLLRAQFNDARFHFVLVCGAVGCPPLINKAYLPDTLDAQLETQTKKAINGDFLRVNTKKKRVQASQIMEWYKGDFTMKGESEIDFINKYRTEKLEGKYKLSYFPYDWKLNKQ